MPAHPVDWRAVQWVCQGEKLRLSISEKQMVIRRMADRLMANGDSVWTCAVGKVTADELAERMYTSARSVQRMKESLKPAHKRRCPHCQQGMWVYDDGTVEAHPTNTLAQCGFRGPWLVVA